MHVPKALVEHQNRRKMALSSQRVAGPYVPPQPPPPRPIPLRCVSITSHSGLILMRCEIIYERRPSSRGLIGPRAHAPSAPARRNLRRVGGGGGGEEGEWGEGRPDPWTIPNRALWLLNLRDNRAMSGGTPPHRPPPAAVSFMAA